MHCTQVYIIDEVFVYTVLKNMSKDVCVCVCVCVCACARV